MTWTDWQGWVLPGIVASVWVGIWLRRVARFSARAQPSPSPVSSEGERP